MNEVRKDNLSEFAKVCSQFLVELNEKIVFAESCTGGMISSTMAGVPGISSYLCGSFVTYRPDSKRRWLGVNKSTISHHSTESSECAQEMALGSLKQTPEATWALSIVGHLGPDAPQDKDGIIWICIARRSRKGNLKIKYISSQSLSASSREARQLSATETALTLLSRTLVNKVQKNDGKAKLRSA